MSDPEAYREFIAGLKPGDEVLVSYNNARAIETVDRLTPTQIIVGRSNYYRTGPRTGRRVGDSTGWSYAELARVSQLDRDTREIQELQGKLRRAIERATLDQLRAMAALMPC